MCSHLTVGALTSGLQTEGKTGVPLSLQGHALNFSEASQWGLGHGLVNQVLAEHRLGFEFGSREP